MQTARTEPAEPAKHQETARRWVYSMIHGSAGLSASQVGGKAWNLARLADAGALVPPWVVIPAWVFDRFAAAAVSSRGGAVDCARALQILQETPLGARVTTARDLADLEHCWSALAARGPLIFRARGTPCRSVLRSPVRLRLGRTPE